MKAEDIYSKALTEYPIKEKLNEKAVGTYDANYPRRNAFVAGAEWMREEMIENPDGGALLYAVEKTAERTKKEMIEKAVKWMYNYFVIDHFSMTSAGFGVFELAFKQAMQDESK
jgi:hypothetical protein